MPPPIDEKQIPLKERYWTQRFVRCFMPRRLCPYKILPANRVYFFAF